MCGQCLGTEARNETGAAESLLCCGHCKSYTHLSCLNLADNITHTTLKVLFTFTMSIMATLTGCTASTIDKLLTVWHCLNTGYEVHILTHPEKIHSSVTNI